MSESEKQNFQSLIDLAEASKMTGYHQNYLAFLCRQKQLPSFKVGRNWLIPKSDLEEFIKIRKNGIREVEDETGSKIPVYVKSTNTDEGGAQDDRDGQTVLSGEDPEKDISGQPDPPKFLSLNEVSKITGYHKDYLAFLCRTGKLQSFKIGRDWATTQASLDEFIAFHKNRNDEQQLSAGRKTEWAEEGGQAEVPVTENAASPDFARQNAAEAKPTHSGEEYYRLGSAYLNNESPLSSVELNAAGKLNGLKSEVFESLNSRISILGKSLDELETKLAESRKLAQQTAVPGGQPADPGKPVVEVAQVFGEELKNKFASNFDFSGAGGLFRGSAEPRKERNLFKKDGVQRLLESFKIKPDIGKKVVATCSVIAAVGLAASVGVSYLLQNPSNGGSSTIIYAGRNQPKTEAPTAGAGFECSDNNCQIVTNQYITRQNITKVLGQDAEQIYSLIDQRLSLYVAEGKFKGEQGIQGPQGPAGAGGLSYTGAPAAPVGIIPSNPASGFSGGTIMGVTVFSADTGDINTIKTANLTVKNSASFSGPAVFSGPVEFNSTATLASLSSGSINPGFASGSIVFQRGGALAEDNGNFFYDQANKRLGIGTSTPSASLAVVASSTSSPVFIASQAGETFFAINSYGNIGVGTATPDQKFTVAGNAYITGALYDSNNSPGFSGQILSSTGAGTAWFSTTTISTALGAFLQGGNSFGGTAILGTTDNQNLAFETNGVTRLIISKTGYVGVGTSSPSAMLAVTGTSTVPLLSLMSSTSAQSLFVANNGNVGIGTVGPTSSLDVNGDINLATNLRINTLAVLTSSGGLTKVGSYYSSSQLAFYGGAAERIRIDNNGNVGIGTTSPSQLLTVGNNNQFTVSSAGALTAASALVNGVTTLKGELDFTTGGDARLKVTDGNSMVLAIGSTDYMRLYPAASGVRFYMPNWQVQAGQNANFGTADNYNLNLQAGSAGTVVTIATSSYVGIGTLTPAAKLDVEGTGGVILNSGNVGIGTTSPVANLHIDSGGAALPVMRMSANGASVSVVGRGSNAFNEAGTTDFAVMAPTGQSLFLGTGSGYGAVIKNGNVGIGTTSPAYKLDVEGGNAYVQNGANNGKVYFATNGNPIYVGSSGYHLDFGQAGYNVTFNSDSGTGALISPSGGLALGTTFTAATPPSGGAIIQGNVGIGTTGPVSLLTVGSASSPYAGALTKLTVNGLVEYQRADDGTNAAGQYWVNTTSNKKWAFFQRGASASPVDGLTLAYNNGSTWTNDIFNLYPSGNVVFNAGNVGIGTTSPAAKLDVNGSVIVRGDGTSYGYITNDSTIGMSMRWNSTSGNGISFASNSFLPTSDGAMALGTSAYSWNGLTVRLDSNLSSGIPAGGSPTTVNSIKLINSGTGSMDISAPYSGAAAGGINFAVGGASTNVRIDKNGNVGIGTTGPSQLLTVGNNNQFTVGSNGAVNAYNITSTGQIYGNSSAPGRFNGGILAYGWGGTIPNAILQGESGATSDFLDVNSFGNTGGNVFVIKQTGNVGIGTTGPGAKLDVAGSGGIIGRFTQNGAWSGSEYALSVSGYSNFGGLRLNGADGQRAIYSASGELGFGSNSNDISFSTDAAGGTRMVVIKANTGNVGIGTTNPGLGKTSEDLYLTLSSPQSGTTRPGLQFQGLRTTDGDVGVIRAYNGTNEIATWSYARDGADNSGAMLFRTANAGSPTEKMRIDKNGNVGIGTTAPGDFVHLYKSGAAETVLRLQLAGGTNNPDYKVKVNESMGAFTIGRTGIADDLVLKSGNVGIGTTGPNEKLDVNGAIQVRATSAGYGSVSQAGVIDFVAGGAIDKMRLISYGTAGNFGGFQFVSSKSNNTGSFVAMAIDNLGNVGIGTTSPQDLLHLYKASDHQLAIDASGQYSTIDFKNNNTTKAQLYLDSNSNIFTFFVNGGTGNNGQLAIGTGNGTEKVRIDTNGNVGIGTTGPGYLLDVNSAAGDSYIGIDSGASSANTGIYFNSKNSGVLKQARIYSDYNGNLNLVPAGGNVNMTNVASLTLDLGSGSSNATLNLVGRNGGTGSTADIHADYTGGLVLDSASGKNIYLNPGGTEKVRIQSDGNVGIGTTGPGYPLDVNGNANISGNLKVSTTQGSTARINLYQPSVKNWYLDNTGTSGLFRIWDGTNADLSIDTNGNVGIGTTSPISKLHVNGNVVVGSDLGTMTQASGITMNVSQGYNTFGFGYPAQWAMGITAPNAFDAASRRIDITDANGGWPGTPLVTFMKSGNVGIGTTSPQYKLDMYAGSGLGAVARLYGQNGAGSNNSQLRFAGQKDGELFAIGTDISAGDGSQRFEIYSLLSGQSGTRLTIQNNGNVGIGTTNPLALLNISGAAPQFIYTDSSQGVGLKNFRFVNNGQKFAIDAVNDNVTSQVRMFITDRSGNVGIGGNITDDINYGGAGMVIKSGNVGIGTTSPGNTLVVQKDNNGITDLVQMINASTGTGAQTRIRFDNNTTVGLAATAATSIFYTGGNYSGYPANAFGFWNGQNGPIGFATNNTEKLRLGANGGLSLGNSYIGTDPGAGSMIISGNVGIGTTSPDSLLSVYGGAIRVRSDATHYTDYSTQYLRNQLGSFYIDNNSVGSGSNIYFRTSNASSLDTNAVTVQYNGNVGIGTTSPVSKLTVWGTGTANGINFNGDVNLYRYASGVLATDQTFYPYEVRTQYAGSAAEPAYNFVSNNNTGMFNPATNQLAFSLGGAEKVRIDNNGNVGIGTTSPSNKLHIYTTTSADGLSIDGNNNPAIVLRVSGMVKGYAPAVVTGAGGFFSDAVAGDMAFRSESNNILFGQGSGNGSTMAIVGSNVGIGSSSPVSKLSVQSATANLLSLANGSGEVVRVLNNGNVGIGTTGPVSLFSVVGAVSSNPLVTLTTNQNQGNGNILVMNAGNATNRYIFADNGNFSAAGHAFINYNPTSGNLGTTAIDAGGGSGASRIIMYDGSGGTKNLFNGNGDSYITAGNIGIGTNSPSQLLSVGNNNQFTVDTLGNVSAANGTLANIIASGATITLRNNGSGSAGDKVAISTGTYTVASGQLNAVAVKPTYNESGTTSNTDLLIQRTETALGSGAQYLFQAGTSTNTNLFSINNTGQVYAAGNVGIGTTSPTTFKLQVAGNIGPDADSTYDLGGGTNRYQNIYGRFFNSGANSMQLTAAGSIILTAGTNVILTQNSVNSFTSEGSGAVANTLYLKQGNVGIGTTTVNSRLVVQGSGSDGTTNALSVVNSAGNGLMVINNQGNVGIGTTSPATKLTIQASAGADVLNIASSTGSSMLYFDKNGNLGVGTASPGVRIDVRGAISAGGSTANSASYGYLQSKGTNGGFGVWLESASDDSALTIIPGNVHVIRSDYYSTGSTRPIAFNMGASEKVRIDTNGNVGIGTSNPSSLLTLKGSGELEHLEGAAGTATYSKYYNGGGVLVIGVDSSAGGNMVGGDTGYSSFISAQNATNLVLATGDVTRIMILSNGNVGIGTSSPSQKLSIGSAASGGNVKIANGWLCVDNNDTCTGAATAGTIYATNGTVSGGADVAENYPTQEDSLEAGDVVSADPGFPVHVSKGKEFSAVLGVVSTKPGVLLGNNTDYQNASTVPVALAGRVPVKVTNENGPIKIGDYLTVSKLFPGYAMKATEPGQVFGRALESFSSATQNDQGKILVFIQFTYYQPTVAEMLQNGQSAGNSELTDWLAGLTDISQMQASAFGDVVVTGSVAIQKDLTVKGVVYAAELRTDLVTAKKIDTDELNAQKICIKDLCIGYDELKIILEKNNSAAPQSQPQTPAAPAAQPSDSSQQGEVAGTSTPASEPSAETSPAVTADPAASETASPAASAPVPGAAEPDPAAASAP